MTDYSEVGIKMKTRNPTKPLWFRKLAAKRGWNAGRAFKMRTSRTIKSKSPEILRMQRFTEKEKNEDK